MSLQEVSERILMNESRIKCDIGMRDIVVMAIAMIPETLSSYPIFFAYDDFLTWKEGNCFEAKERRYAPAKNGKNTSAVIAL